MQMIEALHEDIKPGYCATLGSLRNNPVLTRCSDAVLTMLGGTRYRMFYAIRVTVNFWSVPPVATGSWCITRPAKSTLTLSHSITRYRTDLCHVQIGQFVDSTRVKACTFVRQYPEGIYAHATLVAATWIANFSDGEWADVSVLDINARGLMQLLTERIPDYNLWI